MRSELFHVERTLAIQQLDAVLAEIFPGALYAVGGRVRDELRSAIQNIEIPLKDLDYLVAGLEPAEVKSRLEEHRSVSGINVVGASFSVFKVTIEDETVDIALPRRERSTGIGHREFEIESGGGIPVEDDLARRDFRMNMLARELPNGKLVDPYDGEADIRARRISVLHPSVFEEDPLRILRAVQFAARFAFTIEPATFEAMKHAAPLIKTVSVERICEELIKLFQAPKPSIGIELLRTSGVLQHIWPEFLEGVGVEQNEWHAYDVWRHNLETLDASTPADPVNRLAALFHDIGKPRTKDGPHFYQHERVGAEMAREMLDRFKFPLSIIEIVEHLVRQHMYTADPEISDPALRRFIRRISPEHLARQFALRHADIAGSGLPKREGENERFEARVWAEVARKPAFSVNDLAIGGDDVIAAMVRRGLAPPNFRGDVRVGDALNALFEQVTDEPERNLRGSLLESLERYLGEIS